MDRRYTTLHYALVTLCVISKLYRVGQDHDCPAYIVAPCGSTLEPKYTDIYLLRSVKSSPGDAHRGLSTSTFTLLQLRTGSRRGSKCSYTLEVVQKFDAQASSKC